MGTTKIKAEKKEEKKEEKKVAKPAKIEKPTQEIRAIIRVLGADLDGEKPLLRSIRKIKGISHTMGRAIIKVSGFDPKAKLGALTEKDIQKLEEIIRNPEQYGIPSYLMNKRKDVETGKDMHLTGADLDLATRFDVQRMVDMKSYKGVRHMLGLPARGQRTRSSFRKGRAVGVIRKAVRITLDKGEEKEEKKVAKEVKE